MTNQETRGWYDKLQALAMINWEGIPTEEDLDDARFYIDAGQGNIIWVYHDDCAPQKNTICQYELSINDFLYFLEKFSGNPSKEYVDELFQEMEECCTSHVSVTPENGLHSILEKIFNSNQNFVGASRNAKTLGDLISAINSVVQYEDAQMAEYCDAFFVDKDAEKVTWMYYNPDSNAGGQYVNNSLNFSEILSAAEKHDDPEAFFDYLGSIAYQTIEDIGTVEFEAEKQAFLKAPDLKDITKETMDSLIATAKGGNMNE